MNIGKGIKLLFSNKDAFVIRLLKKYPYLSTDKFFLKKIFKQKLGRSLNLDNPQTFNEKLQWLKLYYRNPILTTMVDKVEVKKYVADKIGEEYLIPTLGVWNSFDEINIKELPNQFVLKTNHDYGGIVICEDKLKLDYNFTKRKLSKHLKRNFYYSGREWAYKDVKPQVLAERYMVDQETGDLRDYKFFCFDGEPKLLFVATDRQRKDDILKFDFFDLSFNHLNVTQGKRGHNREGIKKPINFEKMIELTKILSEGLPHVRVDFYEINGKIYFGELTFYHDSGFQPFIPEEWDYKLGSYLNLPAKQKS